jgi:hypothetical protein
MEQLCVGIREPEQGLFAIFLEMQRFYGFSAHRLGKS